MTATFESPTPPSVSGVVRVAAVHSAAPFLDLHGGIAAAQEKIREAAAEGADVVVFPEAYLPGYPYWIWSHTAKHAAPLFAELFANSIALPSEESRMIGHAAREAGVWVNIGVNEREGGTLYNTMAWFSPEGELVARHRKLQPTNAERTVWGRGDGRDVFVVDTGRARLGGLICFEHTMELSRYALTALGEQIHVASWPAINATHADPNADSFDHYVTSLASSYAICGQSYVVVTQGRITEEIVERLGVERSEDKPTVGGGMSGFMGPDGKWLSEPHRDDDAIIVADLDLGVLALPRFFADSGGHYARPDVFTFGVNTSAQEVLSTQAVGGVDFGMGEGGEGSGVVLAPVRR